jgi:hypothetical protein
VYECLFAVELYKSRLWRYNSPSAVPEASIGTVSSTDIVLIRFEGGSGDGMLDSFGVDSNRFI